MPDLRGLRVGEVDRRVVKPLDDGPLAGGAGDVERLLRVAWGYSRFRSHCLEPAARFSPPRADVHVHLDSAICRPSVNLP